MRMDGGSAIYSLAPILFLTLSTEGCFIRSCPPGGKRSAEYAIEVPRQKECLSCGPQGEGQCVGPNICCGPQMGCYIDTWETEVCARENDIPTLCEVRGEPCGNSGGKCVAEGVCCTDNSCSMDVAECRSNYKEAEGETSDRAKFLNYIQAILKKREYG